MSLFLVRDDDANATTNPALLERTYAPLFDEGMPVCFATIPRVALDTRDPDGLREGFLDPSSPDCSETRVLERETPLAAWLRAHQPYADVLVHGLTHARVSDGTELGALGATEARDRIDRARRIATDALGRTPLGFVAPWDALSRQALVAATNAFDLVSTGFVDRRRLPPSDWVAHARERFTRSGALRVGHGWVLRHAGCRIGPRTDPADVPAIVARLCERARIAVIVLHHWQFPKAAHEPPPSLCALAQALQEHRVIGVREAIRVLDET